MSKQLCNMADVDGPIVVCKLSKMVLTELEEDITRIMFVGPTELVLESPLKYSNLVTLFLLQMIITVPSNFFTMLNKLQNLTLFQVTLKGMPPEMPSSVRYLQLFEITSEKPLNGLMLSKLEFIQYTNSQLTEFPPLASTAPLKVIDLTNNPLTSLTLPDISNYCLLRALTLINTSIQHGSDASYCEIATWCKTHLILTCPVSKLNSAIFSTKVCNETTVQNAEALQKYSKCISQGWWINLALLLGAVLIFSFVIILGVIFFLRDTSTDPSSDPTAIDNDLETEANEETPADTET